MIYDQRWDMYVFIREPKFSSIGYKVGARFRLSYKYINVPCLFIILSFISALKMHKTITRVTKSTRLKMSYFIMHFQRWKFVTSNLLIILSMLFWNRERETAVCEELAFLLPASVVLMLYGLYLVECWHSNTWALLRAQKVIIMFRKIPYFHSSREVYTSKNCVFQFSQDNIL